jgi:hypothetical protein
LSVRLQELLDYLRDNILNDRSDAIEDESDPDQLWTDATLVRNINEAQRRFAKRAFVIRDSTTAEVVNVTLEEGVTEYTLHPSILSVLSAKVDGATNDLMRVGHVVLGDYSNPNAEIYNAAMLDQLSAGAPRAITTDETLGEDDDGTVAAVVLRVYPEPDAAADGTVIKLRVVRMPLDQLTVNNLSAVPEIPVDHHIEMLDWAAYLCLRIMDQDAGNPKRAQEFAASFEQHVKDAKTLVLRKLRAPQPWGFGRGGFRWGGNYG